MGADHVTEPSELIFAADEGRDRRHGARHTTGTTAMSEARAGRALHGSGGVGRMTWRHSRCEAHPRAWRNETTERARQATERPFSAKQPQRKEKNDEPYRDED